MARQIAEEDLEAIMEVVAGHPEGASTRQVLNTLGDGLKLRTLQYRLKQLVGSGRLVQEGKARAARYRLADAGGESLAVSVAHGALVDDTVQLSAAGKAVKAYVSQPMAKRKPVGYDRGFLESYKPNETYFLSEEERAQLHRVGRPQIAGQPAGSYAKQILNRVLIDLSWNSSRLEGNTYSLIDTKRLIEFGQAADGKDQLEAQMILNHKDAIEFLVSGADEIGFNRYTVCNLHAMLANNLLADPDAPGRLRRIAVGIERSAFHPLEVPAAVEECFDQLLASAAAIEDPFEQALFVMVQLPYLQPFDNVNKRVSRLSANIPLFKANLSPLSFEDVPKDLYTQAILGVYESNDVALLKNVFLWAYERSAARYAAVRQSLGEPDPVRLRYREQLRVVITDILRGGIGRKEAFAYVSEWAKANIEEADLEAFRIKAETELSSLHEGNFARYRIRPSEFKAWQEAWNAHEP